MTRILVGVVLCGFFLGVVLRSVADVELAFIWFLLLLGGALGVWGYYWMSHSRALRTHPTALIVAVFFVTLSLGTLRTHMSIARPLDQLLTAQIGEYVSVVGHLVAEPDEREHNTRLTVALDEILGENRTWLSVFGRTLVVVPSYPQFEYGDRLMIEGRLLAPQTFEDETGRTFNYPAYLAEKGIHYELRQSRVEHLSSQHGNALVSWLLALKNTFLERVNQLTPEPHASLLGGLTLGARRSLGEELLGRFRSVGLIHIVVLSGYNISIIADAALRLTKRLFPRWLAFGLAVTTIILFALMTGGSATIVRASVMALIAIIARATDRIYDMTRALIFTGASMVLHNPLILVFDPSFQLSFLATLALILFAPRLEPHLTLIPRRWKLREITAATIATQLFVLPLLLFRTGELSVVSLPANLLVLIAVPTTMFFGFLAGGIGLVSIALATPLAWVATALLGYILAVVNTFSSLPFASISIPPLPLWGVTLVYGCICGALVWVCMAEARNPLPQTATNN